jgi:hypothetical protein
VLRVEIDQHRALVEQRIPIEESAGAAELASVTLISNATIPVCQRRSSRKRSMACCNWGSLGPDIPTENEGSINSLPVPRFTLDGMGIRFSEDGGITVCANKSADLKLNIRNRKIRTDFTRLPSKDWRCCGKMGFPERHRTLLWNC